MKGILFQDLTSHTSLYETGQTIVVPYNILAVCFEGAAVISMDGVFRAFNPRNVLIILSGSRIKVTEVSSDYLGYALKIDNSIFQRLSLVKNSAQYRFIEQNPIALLSPDSYQIVLTFRSLFEQLSRRSSNSYILNQTMFSLFTSFELEISQAYLCSAVDQTPLDDAYLLFNEFLSEVHKKHATERNVAYYADHFAMSRPQLTKIIRENSGKTPKEWINEAVLHTAKDMLVSFNLTVSEIAFQLNFTHQSAFGSFFKKETGVTPQQYRDVQRNSNPSQFIS